MLVGFKYRVTDSVEAEVRKSCRDEFKILYSGGPFDAALFEKLATLGPTSVFEASKISPKMKNLIRIHGHGVRVEGAIDGAMIVAFFDARHRSARRHALERLLGRRPSI